MFPESPDCTLYDDTKGNCFWVTGGEPGVIEVLKVWKWPIVHRSKFWPIWMRGSFVCCMPFMSWLVWFFPMFPNISDQSVDYILLLNKPGNRRTCIEPDWGLILGSVESAWTVKKDYHEHGKLIKICDFGAGKSHSGYKSNYCPSKSIQNSICLRLYLTFMLPICDSLGATCFLHGAFSKLPIGPYGTQRNAQESALNCTPCTYWITPNANWNVWFKTRTKKRKKECIMPTFSVFFYSDIISISALLNFVLIYSISAFFSSTYMHMHWTN